MKSNIFILMTVFCSLFTMQYAHAADPIDDIKKVADQFVKLVDINDVDNLKPLLHVDLVQFVFLGDKWIPFKTPDFIQMVSEKKIGGKPRTVEYQNVVMLSEKTGQARIRAVSDEYDFVYQLSLVKDGKNWIIVGITTEIKEA